jgi:hypothetical protein
MVIFNSYVSLPEGNSHDSKMLGNTLLVHEKNPPGVIPTAEFDILVPRLSKLSPEVHGGGKGERNHLVI